MSGVPQMPIDTLRPRDTHQETEEMKKIAITGAAGVVGSGLRRQLLQRGYRLRLLDLQPINDCAADETAAVADIMDQAAMLAQLRGADALVHLAACTVDAPWPDQVRLSIEGCINVFDAAREAGVNRIVYASSHHVVGMHPRPPAGPLVDAQVQLRPDSRYAVGKAFGESLAALYAYKFGMQVMAIRIGNANTQPVDRRRMGNWISWRDLGQLVAIGLEHPALVFEVVYGISDTTGRHYDNASAYALGYRPEDGTAATGFEAEVLRQDPAPAADSALAESAGELSLGGYFSQSEYTGSTARLRAQR